MGNYQIGDWVVLGKEELKVNGTKVACQIDGVTSKLVDGKMMTRYESGDQVFSEEDILGKFSLEKPRVKRTRKRKAEQMTVAEGVILENKEQKQPEASS